MKAIVGIDVEGHYLAAINLLARLKFNDLSAELMHVDEVGKLAGASKTSYGYLGGNAGEELREGRLQTALNAAQSEAKTLGLNVSRVDGIGRVSEALRERAEETDADLIVVGSAHNFQNGPLVMRGTTRTLAIASTTSVLVAKGNVSKTGDLTAVFFTDGSAYSTGCLRDLLARQPKGLCHVEVVAAVGQISPREPQNEFKSHVSALAREIEAAGCFSGSKVIEGDASEVIEQRMQFLHADLVIIGAPPQGILEQMFVGSLSLRQIVASPHSVLLLRRSKSV